MANFCFIISGKTITHNSTSVDSIWQTICAHFSSQSTGGHFLDLADLKFELEKCPEDLFLCLTAVFEDNILTTNGVLKHQGELLPEGEEMKPSLKNFITLFWLKLIYKDLLYLVKQCYGTKLRSQTLASIKPEVSQAIQSMLDELRILV